MSRKPVDDGLFIDQVWRSKKLQGHRIVIVQIHRKDKKVLYEPVDRPGLRLVMLIRYLRENYDPETIYIAPRS